MLGNAICPRCAKDVTRLDIRSTQATTLDLRTFNAICLVCPDCNVVLGASLDPTVIGKDIVNRIVGNIGQMLRRR